MKKTLLFAALALTAGFATAQTTWTYDFGTGTGVHNTNSASLTFLPQPSTNGGEDRVRVGSGGGSFSLVNPGSGSELVGVAPTGGSVNKFSIYDFTPGTTTFTLQFDVKFSGGSSGTWSMFAGDGASFSDSNAFTGAQVFTGLRWTYGASDAITTSYRNGANWNTLTGTGFAQSGDTFRVEIYGNNSASGITYGANSLAANTWDLWVDGTRVGEGLNKGQLAAAANIDSFMFYGESSTGNVATITLDNFTYANYAIPEPSMVALLLVGFGIVFRFIRRK